MCIVPAITNRPIMNAMRIFIYVLLGLIGSAFLGSCIKDDMTTSSSDLLTFSRDTVNFDTVFTGEGTPTARLIVFNRSKKGINISNIRLRDPDTHFQINVDGVSGSDFKDVEIRGNDSIYVFIECLIEESESDIPQLTADELLFVTNGVTQSVRLEAYGQNVTRLSGMTVSDDYTLLSTRPYVVMDSLVVAESGCLRIEPGVKLLFHDGAYMHVKGRLEAVGEPGNMIQMRGDRLDDVLPDVGYDILAGQWKGIRIAPGSFDNRMEYVDMRSSEIGLVADSCSTDARTKVLLRNSWLHNSQGTVLKANNARIEAYGCCFSEAADAVISLFGGDHKFVQCTFANNYLFSAISEAIVTLNHLFEKDSEFSDAPLMKAEFDNCIIYGLAADISVEDLTGSEVFLNYVSLKAGGSDDDNFRNCIWDCDPLFETVREDYYFNYRLKEDSPVLHAGDPFYVTSQCSEDMYGVSRLADGLPALGAYAK